MRVKSIRLRAFLLIAAALLAVPSNASDLAGEEFNIYFGSGRSLGNWHGHLSVRSLHFEMTGRSSFVERWLRGVHVGASISYNDIRQPRSWFGYQYGDPNDSVRGEGTYFFLRRGWRDSAAIQPFVDIGTGPMWSNRRVPAATSRFNFNSQAGLGVVLFAQTHPVRVMYRFSHISNFGMAGRNPGWNVSSLLIGTRVRRLRP